MVAAMAMTSAPASCTPTPCCARYASSTSMACPPARWPTAPSTRRTAAAAGLCELAAQEWEGGVDGLVRMEGGFEVVLCEFERRLDVVWITQARGRMGMGMGMGMGMRMGREKEARERGIMQYYKAIAARYDEIDGRRVVLDYEHLSQHTPTPSTSSTSVAKWRWERREARMRIGKG
jgi:hypothetical protein